MNESGTMTAKAVRAIRRESKRIGWPEAFGRDLECDVAALRRSCPQRFGWILCRTGTHLLWHDQAPEWTSAVIRHMADCMHQTGSPACFYWWDGRKLQLVTPDEMASCLNALREQTEVEP